MKFYCSLTVILLCLFSLAQAGEYYQLDGLNYYVSTPDQADWYQAMRFCRYQGMNLVDVRTSFENSRILNVIDQNKKKYGLTYADYWTSGTDLASEKQFYWATTGHPILWEYWATAEPSYTGERCVHYYNTKGTKWNDNKCETKMYFICRGTQDNPVHKESQCTA